jgi:hypothetical protein
MKIIKERPMAMMIRMVFMFDLLFGSGVQPDKPHLLKANC